MVLHQSYTQKAKGIKLINYFHFLNKN